jgi:predicted nucleic acid-binding protein
VAFCAIYDANVLYPAPLRDLLIELGRAGEFRARYSAEILDEVFEHLFQNRPDLRREDLERTRQLMEQAIADVLVTGHMDLVDSLDLPDPDDRHVLAAAIVAGADVIVTSDKTGFPASALETYEIEAQNADVFVHHLVDLHPGIVVRAVENISRRLRNPPKSVEEIIATLEHSGLVQSMHALRRVLGLKS